MVKCPYCKYRAPGRAMNLHLKIHARVHERAMTVKAVSAKKVTKSEAEREWNARMEMAIKIEIEATICQANLLEMRQAIKRENDKWRQILERWEKEDIEWKKSCDEWRKRNGAQN